MATSRSSEGKLRNAVGPCSSRAAMSNALAASSGVPNVPNQIRESFLGSRISAAHFPHFRSLTPRNPLGPLHLYALFFTLLLHSQPG